jgi:quercetin dioxygenase-like cupin family protein
MAATTQCEEDLASPSVLTVPQPDWSPVPHEGCRDVEGKVLLRTEGLSVAMLRFAPDGTIHEHSAPYNIDVVCLEGRGMTSLDGESEAISAGQSVRWPAGAQHRLWTEDGEMVTLMIEHVGAS